MDVILEETGDSTGVFDQLVLVVDELPEGNQIWGKVGNTLTVTYEDDFDATGEELDVVATARIGVVLEYPVPASDPMVVDSAGMPIEAPAVGQLLVIQSNLTNIDAIEHDFVYLVQIKDEAGVIVHLAFLSGTLEAGQTMFPGISWIPEAAGTYTAEIFVWKSLVEPEPLSLVQTIDITVSG
ncbi:MAG: hypothetical protein GTN80_00500 [Nitrososphaeria archaeon]|nr:hypothetical protein [Nitrososphaeria archaeon]NIQ32125.1 hypothetical protein [Nitrososphaeria archaeon]